MFRKAELNDMWKCMVEVVAILVFSAIFVGWIFWFMLSDSSIRCDYTTSIKVDDSSKIEQAISNVVNDVKSRNFIMTKLEVTTWHDRHFNVICGGVDRGNFLKR